MAFFMLHDPCASDQLWQMCRREDFSVDLDKYNALCAQHDAIYTKEYCEKYGIPNTAYVAPAYVEVAHSSSQNSGYYDDEDDWLNTPLQRMFWEKEFEKTMKEARERAAAERAKKANNG